MEGRFFIRGCAIWRDGAVHDSRSVVIDGEAIFAIDSESALKALPGDWVCDARGRLLTPGLFQASASTGTAAGDRLLVATALRRGVTTIAIDAAREAAEIGARLVKSAGQPGRLEPSAPADLVLWDLVAGPRFDPSQLEAALAAWVIVGGRVVVREGQLVGHDFVSLAAAAK